MKRAFIFTLLAFGLASCEGPRSYQVEAHAAGGAIIPQTNSVTWTRGSGYAGPMIYGRGTLETEAAKAQNFWGGSK